MQADLVTSWSVRDMVDGFVYNEYEGKGLYGMGGRLVIQPEFQRNYIYAEAKREAPVVDSVLKGYPIGLLYFVVAPDGKYEILDGQQRITSLGRFYTRKFAIKDSDGMEQYFDSLPDVAREKFLAAPLTVYICKGDDSEIKDWFRTINIAGEPLNEQELLNAVYSGPFVTRAKEEFSNSNNSNISKWSAYLKGNVKRQDFLHTALEWVSRGDVDDYMARHRFDEGISELKSYFCSVIDWASAIFPSVWPQMKGLPWGSLYERYHSVVYNPSRVGERVETLMADPAVRDKKGIFEYVLGGEKDSKLLNVRIFDDYTKSTVYARQTAEAKELGLSNCPLCREDADDSNRTRLWALKDMDADHVTAWSAGGATGMENCRLLCFHHNRMKGNR